MGSPRILLIDDDEAAYLMIRRQLSRLPDKTYALDWVSSYEAGLKALLEGRYDACLLDYRLGPHTGLDLLREISSREPRMPIVMLTSSTDPKVDMEAGQLGAADFLQKDQITPILLERGIRYAIQQFASLAALKKSHQRHRELEREIQQISEREQRRLGQDLHDGLGQALTGIAFMAKALEQRLAAKNIEEASDAGTLTHLINDALIQTRHLARGLCPAVLENNDIQVALLQLAENLRIFFGVCCATKLNPKIKVTDNSVAVHLYRIAQEATTNAIKHGKAKNISIGLYLSGSRLVLRIEDDGIGFSKTPTTAKGMGLQVMQHRARSIGATLAIRPAKDHGTVVVCSLKLRSETANHSITHD